MRRCMASLRIPTILHACILQAIHQLYVDSNSYAAAALTVHACPTCIQACTFIPPRPPSPLRALPWALAAAVGAAGCVWLLRWHCTWRLLQRTRQQQQQQAHESTSAAAPCSACGRQSESGGGTPSSFVLRRSADGTILSPFQRESSLPPFSSNSSPACSPRAPCSGGAGALAAEAARRMAALLALPTAGSSLRVPWLRLLRREDGQSITSQGGVLPQQPQHQEQQADAAAGLSPSTPEGSNEQMQDQSGGSAQVPGSSSWAAPPPELARHLAALQQSPPPPAAGGMQQLLEHGLSASSLPPRLRELFVEPSTVKVVPGLRGRLGEGAR